MGGCDFDFLLEEVVVHFDDAMTRGDSDMKPSDDNVRLQQPDSRRSKWHHLHHLTILPPNPTSSLYFIMAANTCILIALRDDCFVFSNCHLKV
jgi:hypothetical protein